MQDDNTPKLDPATFLKRTGRDSDLWTVATLRDLGDGTCVFVARLLFHFTVVRGAVDDYEFNLDRWCYEKAEDAVRAVQDYKPDPGYEPTGWHRHPPTGRRRPGGDPSQEYVAG